jgi:hypothetical protein
MVRINTSSIFKSVDLDDAGSIRRVMVALDYCLTNRVLNNATPESELFKRQKNSKRGSLQISFYSESACNPNSLFSFKQQYASSKLRMGAISKSWLQQEIWRF